MMRTIMAKTSHDASFSFSRRHFKWALKRREGGEQRPEWEDEEEEEQEVEDNTTEDSAVQKRRRNPAARLLRSAFMVAVAARLRAAGKTSRGGLGSRVTGTLFGQRRGHVHFAFQVDPKSPPVVLIELATPTSVLVREMASGLVRIALECDRKEKKDGNGGGGAASVKLLEEPFWRTYCNGKKCGYAIRRECGPADFNVLRAVEPVSMGAGVLPVTKSDANGDVAKADGEVMYMRARFERVVGSKDSEAFYMMNPDGNCGPELSIYLLRV